MNVSQKTNTIEQKLENTPECELVPSNTQMNDIEVKST